MKKFKLISLLMALVLSLGMLAGCGGTPTDNSKEAVNLDDVNSSGANVQMSVLYNGKSTMMKFYDENIPYLSLNGTKYLSNHWKPAWAQLQTNLDFKIQDVTPQSVSSVALAFSRLQANRFANVNILSGPVSSIVEEGTNNETFIDLNQYSKYLPNFFNFINDPANDIVKKSITSESGEIFYAPYFDGFDDIETMFICRVDWVEKLLDDTVTKYVKDQTTGVETPTVEANSPTYDTFIKLTTKYDGYYDSLNTTFTAMKDASTTQEITLNIASGQGIISQQNALEEKNGQTLTETLKAYIKANYVDKGYISKPSELYCGQNACYNADELIALWRCVKANPMLLTGKADARDCVDNSGESVIVPFYPRDKGGDRTAQVLQLAQLWGVRGYESRNGYFYFDENGKLQDSRVSEDMMEALGFLHELYEEGLICKNYNIGLTSGAEEYRETFNKQNLGFMTYDYNQTTTIFNERINDAQTPYRNLSPILFPVADWDNNAKAVSGKEGQYTVDTNTLYQYTESWRSVKSEGWCITSSTEANPAVLKKCLEIFDYMYTKEGQTLMTYGPKDWIAYDASGNMETISYYGLRDVPKISDAAIAELKSDSLGKGNYTNYYRFFVGSTLPIGFVKEQGMEYQTADKKGLVGLDYIGNARVKGVLKHASTLKGENAQNTLVPTTFALSDRQNQFIINNCGSLSSEFNNSSASNAKNIFHDYVINGFNVSGKTLTKAALIDQINKDFNLVGYVELYQNAYDAMYR